MLRALAGGMVDNALMMVGPENAPPATMAQEPQLDLSNPPAECPAALATLISAWADGFDTTGTRHWDESASNTGPDPKAEALRALSTSSDNGGALKWVASKGGLTHAVHEFVEDKELARSVAGNMAQVASILFTDLADLLEHFDPYEEK